MAPISVRVLGGPAVDGVDPRDFGSRKARRLLELLALGRGRAVPFDVLAEELWPDRRPARPAAQLGPEVIERRDAGYCLHYGRLDLDDLAALTDELERGRAGTAQSGVVAARALTRLALAADPGGMPTGRTAWAVDRSAEASRLVARAVHAGMTAMATASGRVP